MNLAILGAGQIGASLALALKAAQRDVRISVYDPLAAHAEHLKHQGGADAVAASPAEAVAEADIVIIAAPLGCYLALAKAIAPALKPGAIVTDIGSVKAPMQNLAPLLPHAQIVPAHPISGSEKSGPQAAREDLFRGRLCILTPNAAADTHAMEVMTTLWHAMGAEIIAMPAEMHDQIYAYVSHLPHYIAFVTAGYFYRLGIAVASEDTVLRQFLRIAQSNPRMWCDIALANREMLLPVMATYIALLEHFATELRAGEQHDVADRNAVAKAHLPRILAASLISAVSLHEQQSGLNLRPFGAGGMRDIVAPAAQAPEQDIEAISQVAAVLADHLDAILGDFKQLEQCIGAEDGAALLRQLETLSSHAQLLLTPRS